MKFGDIISGDTPVLVDFYADWCGPCKVMAPILQEVKKSLGDNVKIIKIDTDQHQALSASLGIRSIPTLILYKNSQQKWRQSGVVDAHSIVNQIKSLN